MVAKPSSSGNSVDPRLSALTDRELAAQLMAEHPELYRNPGSPEAPGGRREAHPATEEESHTPSGTDFWRVLGIVGLLLAVVASYALGLAMRSRMDADVPPLFSIAPAPVICPGRLSNRPAIEADYQVALS